MRAGFTRDNGLVRVPESTAVGVAGVDIRLGEGGGEEFDVGFLVVGFVEEDSLRGMCQRGRNWNRNY